MVEKDGCNSCLTAIRSLRVSLVDELEGRIDSLLEVLVSQGVFNSDDREDVLCNPGPRSRVRKVLDILQCKGEEAAKIFFTIRNCQQETHAHSREINSQSAGYHKIKDKHKDVLRRRSENMLLYNTRHGEKLLFSKHYVNLLLLNGHQGLEVKRHEVLSFGQKRPSVQHESASRKKISPAQLFCGNRPIKKVLVTGVAGIGKTVLVQKILHDFGRNKEHLVFDFIIHMTFRDLNLTGKPTSFRELVLQKYRHLAKELDNILANDKKLLIILDGFDEFRHYRSFDVDIFVTEPDDDAEVVQILGSLMQGELLPDASVMLTSRPAAISHIPVGCVDRFVLIAGFSLTEVKDFFLCHFQDDAFADQMFAMVSANEPMLTMCFIPAFCCIVCCILRETKEIFAQSPKTMTDIYVQYLVALIHSHTQSRIETFHQVQKGGGSQQLSEAVLKLGRLAYNKLMEQQTLFYSTDPELAALGECSLVSTFLDKTVSEEPGCTEDIYSFAHLTVQEFFAAIYCAAADHPLPDVLQCNLEDKTHDGHLDLFNRFLSGILSERNTHLLSRHLGLSYCKGRVDSYRQKIIRELMALCDSGAHILNHLHCLFEQQDPALVSAVQPKMLRVHIGDETLSQMDYNAIKYFLNLKDGKISELDLTGTGLTCEALRDIQPLLLRCERLWLGENNLDTDMVQIIAEVLQISDNITQLGIGWSNVGDDELLTLSRAIQVRKRLKELWMEGNRVTAQGLLSLSNLTPNPLKIVVAIWNEPIDRKSESLHGQESVTVTFTDDTMWEAWAKWVFNRCEVSSDERLLMVLHKVCNVSSTNCSETPWVKTFYSQLSQLIKNRIESCSEDDMCKKLKKFENILNL